MATILERPLSAFSIPPSSSPPPPLPQQRQTPTPAMSTSTGTSTSTIPQRRRRPSIEVIDVDELEDQPPPEQRRRLAREVPDVIELLDSEDEGVGADVAAGSSGGGSRPSRQWSALGRNSASGSTPGNPPFSCSQSRGFRRRIMRCRRGRGLGRHGTLPAVFLFG
ncbi:hypothetical protein C8R46DRAFT_516910 [Mycena filopes]|nr:hypothetical protein C8R46DRAFT_516910 [Mycena filopes]